MKITVLAGGNSPERQISEKSGIAVASALIRKGFEVALIDPAREYPVNDNLFFDSIAPALEFFHSSQIEDDVHITLSALALCEKADKVFIALHGGIGENGRLSALFDCLGIKYTGSCPEALSLSMDKILSKQIYSYFGILTPDFTIYKKGENTSPLPPRYPCFVKPAVGGSSLGATLVMRPFEMKKAIEKAFSYCDTALIEVAVFGRELTVSVLEDKPLAVTEMVKDGVFFDYRTKYTKNAAKELTPAPLPQNIYEKAMKTALNAHRSLRMKNFSRTDMILESETSLLYVLETNAVPGLTDESILPSAAKSIGIGFDELCMKMLS
jgi:D-alanine-D-alanine ligase